MIQAYIHLEKTSSLYKNLKKRKFLDKHSGTLFIWLKYKPCIGELLSIERGTISDNIDIAFKSFLCNKSKPIMLRIIDLHQSRMYNADIDVINLKCYEDKSVNWL